MTWHCRLAIQELHSLATGGPHENLMSRPALTEERGLEKQSLAQPPEDRVSCWKLCPKTHMCMWDVRVHMHVGWMHSMAGVPEHPSSVQGA